MSTTMRRLGIITLTNSAAVVTPSLLSSTAAFPGTLTLPSPLLSDRLTNSILFHESRSLSFSCFSSSSSSSAAYLPSLEEYPSAKGDYFCLTTVSTSDFELKFAEECSNYLSLRFCEER